MPRIITKKVVATFTDVVDGHFEREVTGEGSKGRIPIGTVFRCRVTFPYVAIQVITDYHNADHGESDQSWCCTGRYTNIAWVTLLYYINPIKTAHACGPLMPFFPIPPPRF